MNLNLIFECPKFNIAYWTISDNFFRLAEDTRKSSDPNVTHQQNDIIK